MADQVLYAGVACITDLMVKEGLINLDFADVRAVMREMGKAMMGTGEASGEKRALRAAEAAIANPLIDDVSMRGAKGLLVSIIGGKDLTLYEVDEAATRIREEVDPDANIIVGATFDESLEGIIRVSVVATGVDRVEAVQAKPQPQIQAQPRVSEIAQRPRPEPQRHPERVERLDASAGRFTPAGIERAATAAVAAALLPPSAIDEVTIRQIPPKPSLFLDPGHESAPREPQREAAKNFIPPEAERVPMRPRMPRLEDLPLPAQNEIRARRGEIPDADHPEKRRMSLLKRLAAVGLGRREEEEEEPAAAAPRPVIRPVAPAMTPVPPRPAPRPLPEAVSEYARRPAPQGLDMHGRQAPVNKSVEDDQLEIPAFLRRQAN